MFTGWLHWAKTVLEKIIFKHDNISRLIKLILNLQYRKTVSFLSPLETPVSQEIISLTLYICQGVSKLSNLDIKKTGAENSGF